MSNNPTQPRDLMPQPNNAQPHECEQCGKSATIFDEVVRRWFCCVGCVEQFKLDLITGIKQEKENDDEE